MRLEWVSDVPIEIRSYIYKEFFASTSVYYKFDRQIVRNEKVTSAPWNLFLTAKQVKDETEAMFWDLSTFIYDHDFDIPLQWPLWPMQYLIVRGDLNAKLIEALTTLVVQSEPHGKREKRLKHVNVERVLETTYEFSQLDRVITQCASQVDLLELNLNAFVEFDNISADKFDQGLEYEPPEDPECKLTIGNTHNVSINREEEEFLLVLERILTRTYEKDFERLRARVQVEGDEPRSVPLTRRPYEVPEW